MNLSGLLSEYFVITRSWQLFDTFCIWETGMSEHVRILQSCGCHDSEWSKKKVNDSFGAEIVSVLSRSFYGIFGFPVIWWQRLQRFVRGESKMALNSKSKWRKISGENNDASSVISGLLADAEPELCVKLLETPSLKNFSGLRPRLEKASKEWLSEFLSIGGLDCLLDGLSSLSAGNRQSRFAEALEQIECVRCIDRKSVV